MDDFLPIPQLKKRGLDFCHYNQTTYGENITIAIEKRLNELYSISKRNFDANVLFNQTCQSRFYNKKTIVSKIIFQKILIFF